MYQLPFEYNSSVCEIKTMTNELLATGVISQITPEFVEITGRTGAMPTLSYRDEIKLSIFNHQHGFRVLTGMVYISNRKFMRVFEITNILDYERRNFFRLDTSLNAKVILFKADDPDSELPKVPVIVNNLSLGGALLQTTFELEPEEMIQLHLPINGKTCVFTCRIHRVDQKDSDSWMCGCEFLDYSDAQSDVLCSYLFQCQREYLKKT